MSSDICGVRRMMLALADLLLLSISVFRTGGVTPAWRPRMLVTRLLVWPASKAMRTRSQVRRVAIPAMLLAMAVSMTGLKRAHIAYQRLPECRARGRQRLPRKG